MSFTEWVTLAARFFEAAGVAVMVGGALLACIMIVIRRRTLSGRQAYRFLRGSVGSSILLGLELLVGADIIRTIAEEPTLGQVLVLGLIVLIRTFLSFTLEVEITGRCPWRRKVMGFRARRRLAMRS
jgi:uncharacterized membrane protein